MDDRVWLNRVLVAFQVYRTQYSQDQQSVDHFVKYLYREYGIIYPGDPDSGTRK